MSNGIIPALDVHKDALSDGDTIGSAIAPTRACSIRGTIKVSAAVRLQLDVYDNSEATTATGYLNDGDALVVDAWTNFAFEALPEKTYTLKIADAGATVDLLATEVHGSVL